MSTTFNGNGHAQGVIPLPQGQQPGFQPTGQQMQQPAQSIQYGPESLPPMPQAQPAGQAPQGYGLQAQQPPQQGWGQQPQQGQPMQPGWQQPAQQAQPNWGQQAPQQGYGQQPPPQQAFGTQLQQGMQSGQLNLDTVLQGEGVPAALRGRRVRDALSIYSGLEQYWARSQQGGQPQTPAAQSLQQMQPQAQAPQGPPAQPTGNFWSNPEERIAQLVDRSITNRLAPVLEQTQVQAIGAAMSTAAQQIADFPQLEAEVRGMLQNADPSILGNPQAWITAADVARGRHVAQGRYQYQGQPQQQVQVPGPRAPMVGAQPANGQLTPQYGFFTEGPSAPAVNQWGGQQLSARDMEMATKMFNGNVQEYAAWKYGVQQQQVGYGQPQRGGF